MTLLASHAVAWTIGIFALLAASILLVAEWRRSDNRRRPWRLGATSLAVVALALWALRPAWPTRDPETSAGRSAAVLWTQTVRTNPTEGDLHERHRFALPGANFPAAADVTILPDVGTIRRRFPEVGELRIFGDGLDPADLPALAGLRVTYRPPPGTTSVATQPSLLSLRCPRGLRQGETLVVEGRVGGLPAGQTPTLTLEAPDGTTTTVATAVADVDGEAVFAIRAPSPGAAGRFLWKLRLKPAAAGTAQAAAEQTLGIEVRAPVLPRVLVLESAPRFDVTDLRHWYEEAGGTLRARLKVGQDRFRFFAAGAAAPVEFDALDSALLAGYDLVLGDARALASLPAPEREILRAAVADTGLGVLVLADDALLPPAVVAADRAWLFPWQLRALEAAPTDAAAEGGDHLARVQWPGDVPAAVDVPLPTVPCEVVLRPGQTGGVRDDQQRVLAASAPLGRGTLAVTLVRDTGRWLRANEPGAFAGYWAYLFAQTARRLEAPGRWTLADGDNGPVFVDQPLELIWNGPPPRTIRVADESGAPPVALAPAGDPREPGRWRTTFWPRRAGWQRLESDAGRLDFYVHPAGSWPELAAARKRAATARFAARSLADAAAPAPPRPAESTPIPAGWWFGAFLLAAGFLWIGRRGGGRGGPGAVCVPGCELRVVGASFGMTRPSPLRADTLRHIDEVLVRCPTLAALSSEMVRAVEAICACHRAGGKILVCGNGGSASDSEHIVGELAKGFVLRRTIPQEDAGRLRAGEGGTEEERHELAEKLQGGVAAISLTGHPALASAIDNDTGRQMVFAQQVYVYGRPGDILIGLSTSGNSGNVVRALTVGRAFGLTTIGFTGSRPARMDALCDIRLKVPAEETHKIQELHLPVYHTLCLMVEQELFGQDAE